MNERLSRRKRGKTHARHRKLLSERLEPRVLLANDLTFQNPGQQFDVNRDLRVSALDALQVINFVAKNGSDFALPAINSGSNFPDVNGSNKVTALDALQIINQLPEENGPLLAVRLEHDSSPTKNRPISTLSPTDSISNLVSPEMRKGEDEKRGRGFSARRRKRQIRHFLSPMKKRRVQPLIPSNDCTTKFIDEKQNYVWSLLLACDAE